MSVTTNPVSEKERTFPDMIRPRRIVETIQAYSAPLEGRREKIRLDFNENTLGFESAYAGMHSTLMTSYPEYQHFLEELAACWRLPIDRLLLTNGSDEALFLIPFTFIEPGEDKAVVSTPTFPLIAHYIKLCQADVMEVPVQDDLSFDIAGIEAKLADTPKLAVFASPDNPTGSVIPLHIIETWCRNFPNTLFVIDSAYAEYLQGNPAYANSNHDKLLSLIDTYSNLLITRTFSKAWGMAGLRLGVIIGQPQLLDYLQRVRSPYSVNMLAVETAHRLLLQADAVQVQARETMVRKQWVIEEVEKRGYRVIPGAANFFLILVGRDAQALQQFCRQRGVLIRDRSALPKMQGMMRISIGTQPEMERFLQCLDDFRQTHGIIFDMDDTLVDTSQSFDETVKELVYRHTGQVLSSAELHSLRAEGGFNDDWDASVELIRRRGLEIDRDTIAIEGYSLYMRLAPDTERLLVPLEMLSGLAKRYRLFIVTGRTRDEYEPLWKETMESGEPALFEGVYCRGDVPAAEPKPSPDYLTHAMKDAGLDAAVYIGNSVDDMQAAFLANIGRIGVTTTQTADLLTQAGAELILSSLQDLESVYKL